MDQMASSQLLTDHPSCGYTVYDMDSMNNKYKCIYCVWIMKEPTQLTECGHRCCRGCFEFRAAVAGDGEMRCPIDDCGESFRKDQVRITLIHKCSSIISIVVILKIMPDRAFKREMDSLQVICIHKKEENCDWIGPLSAYQVSNIFHRILRIGFA